MKRPLFPLNAWYAAAYDVEVKRDAARAHHLRPEARACSAAATARWPRSKTPAGTACCRCQGHAAQRRGHLRLPRPGLQRRRPLHPHAVAGNHQPVGLRARFPVVQKHRFVWVWPGDPALADAVARCPTCTGTTTRHWAGDGKLHHGEVRLPARARQPDGPDARDLRARHAASASARWPRRPSSRRTATAPRPSRAGWKTSTRRRSGPRSSSTPPATKARSTAGRSSASRRRARSRSTSAWRPPAAARRRRATSGDRSQGVNGYVLNTITPETDAHLPLLLGLRAQLLPRRAAPDARAARRRGEHLPRGRADPRGAAAGDRRTPGLHASTT